MNRPNKSDQAKQQRKEFLPWIEKYRPKSLNDVVHQEQVIRVLKKSIQSQNLPHLLFYGPPGTGKTSTILAAARELFGPEGMKERVLELNASDERGINVVRDKVKQFARISVRHSVQAGYPCPPYKIIILDEADSMTPDAQSALRRTMEKYSTITRFCLICNYVSRLITPITSRCAKYRFKPLSHDSIVMKLNEICEQERTNVSADTLATAVRVSGGDMRKAITLIQSARMLRDDGELVRSEDILRVTVVVPPSVIDKLLAACSKNSFPAIEYACDEMAAEGYPSQQIIAQLCSILVKHPKVPDSVKAALIIRIAEADMKLNDGACEYIQLLDILGALMTAFARSNLKLEFGSESGMMDLSA
eukprot:177022_1